MDTIPPPAEALPRAREREMLDHAVHDLRNQLAVVHASLEWLATNLADRADVVDAVRDATTATERLTTIADDLDSLAQLDGDDRRASVPIALGPLVREVVAAATARLAGRGLTASAITPVGLEVAGDRRLLARCLSALIDAAARGAAAGACVEVTLLGSSTGAERAIELGVGLRGAVDAAPSDDSPQVLSLSLGVYVARRVIEALGGSILTIQTTSLTRFAVRFPP